MDDSARSITPVFLLYLFASDLLLMGLGSLLGTVIFGFDLILRIFGVVVVNRAGRPANRLRLLARSALVWGPMIAGGIVIVSTFLRPEGMAGALWLIGEKTSAIGFGWNLGIGAFIFAALSFLVGVPWTILRPATGPHDLIAGTRVTPR
jgi:hypothetical protein